MGSQERVMDKKQDEATRQIEEHLKSKFPVAQVTAYRQNFASVRVRIIDASFAGQSRIDREEKVFPYLRELPEETREDISVLLLLTPDEAPDSPMNIEFEHPVPSTL